MSRPRSQTASSAPAAPEGVAVASSALSLRLRVRWTPPPPPEGFCCEVRVRFTDSTAPRVSRSSRAAGAARGLRSSQVRAEFSALSTLRRAPRFHACARRIPVSLSPPWVRVASAEASALRPRAARRRRSVGPRGVSRVGCFLGRWSLLAVPSLEGAACRRVPPSRLRAGVCRLLLFPTRRFQLVGSSAGEPLRPTSRPCSADESVAHATVAGGRGLDTSMGFFVSNRLRRLNPRDEGLRVARRLS